MSLTTIKKAQRIAKAYEEAGFLNCNATQALKQMARWAGITVAEARAFAQMAESIDPPRATTAYPASKYVKEIFEMTKHRKICAHCGGEEVRIDAWASWDVDTQEWVLHGVFDASYCDECEAACDVDEVPIEETRPNASDAMGCLVPEENVFDGPMRVDTLSMDNEPGVVMIDEYIEPVDPEIKRALAKLLLEREVSMHWKLPPIIAEHIGDDDD